MRHLTDEQISELLDGFITLSDKQQKHLKSCPECTKKLEEWHHISQYVQCLPLASLSEEASLKISREIKQVEDNPYQPILAPFKKWNYKLITASAMCLLLVLVGIPWVYNYYYQTEETTNTAVSTQTTTETNQIASNNANTVIQEEETLTDRDIFMNLSEEYTDMEPVKEELYSITISDLMLSLAEETDMFNTSM